MVKKLIIAVLLCLLMLFALGAAALAEEEPVPEPPVAEAPMAEAPVPESAMQESPAAEAPITELVTEEIPAEGTPAETITDSNAEPPEQDSDAVETGLEPSDDGTVTEEEDTVGERTEEMDEDASASETEAPATEPAGEEQTPAQQEAPTAAPSSDSTPAETEYVVTISDGSKSVNLAGGDAHRISDILSELGYDVSDAEISPDMDSVDRKVISVTQTEEGFVLTDNGRFSAADRNLIIYVNGNPVELTVVDPTPASGSMTAAQFAAMFTGGDYDVLLTDDAGVGGVSITDAVMIPITSGVHNLFLNGETLELNGSWIEISGPDTVLNIYGGEDISSTTQGYVIGSGSQAIMVSGGTLTGNCCFIECLTTGACGIINESGGNVTISGTGGEVTGDIGVWNKGNLTVEGPAGIVGTSTGGIINDSGGKATITGGDVYVGGWGDPGVCISNEGILNISDGKFVSQGSGYIVNNNGTISITGGQFLQDVAAYVAKGFTQKYDASELYPYSVVQSSWLYQISSGSEITATCTDSGSSAPAQKLIITADAASVPYDGNPHGATVTADTEYSAFSGNASYSVIYKGTGSSYSSAQAPTDGGTYNAELTLIAGGSTYVISAGFEIISTAPPSDPVQPAVPPAVPQKKEAEPRTDRDDLDREIRLDYEDQLALNSLTGGYLPVRKDIVSMVNSTVDAYRQQLDSGAITQQQYDKSVETLERLTAVAAQLGSEMMESDALAAEVQKTLPADCGVDIQKAVSGFYDKQLETLLKTENGVLDLEQYEQYEDQILAAAETYVREMFDSVLMIRNCSDTEFTALINQMVEAISAKTYQDFDEEAAAEEFAENAYEAILKNMQSQVEESVKAAYNQQSGQITLMGTANDSLEEEYAREMESIRDLESFEIMVMEVMRQKYVALLDSKLAGGEITPERYEELMGTAADVESFAPVYRSIFHSWVLKQESEYDITLEELTAATISTATENLKPASYQDELTKADVRMIGIIGIGIVTAAAAGTVSTVTAVRKYRKRGNS